jgi:hypothetical protein
MACKLEGRMTCKCVTDSFCNLKSLHNRDAIVVRMVFSDFTVKEGILQILTTRSEKKVRMFVKNSKWKLVFLCTGYL